eukprot:c44277_g1_i1 orf=124-630(+)
MYKVAKKNTKLLMASRKASLRVIFLHFVRIYCLMTGVGTICFIIYLLLRMVVMWQISMLMQCRSALHLSLLVGTNVGVLAVMVGALFLAPRFIITWITTLVLEVLLNLKIFHGMQAVENGKILAHKISRIALVEALHNGEVAAIVSAITTLVALAFLRPNWIFFYPQS